MKFRLPWTFNKPETPKTSKGSVHTFSTHGLSLQDLKYDYSKPLINDLANKKWIPFGIDNLYPYVLLEMYASSPFHSSIVDYKSNVLAGAGVKIDMKGESFESKMNRAKLEALFTPDFLNMFVKQYIINGRVCLRVNRTERKNISVKIEGSEKIRISNPDFREGYWYSKDWRRRQATQEFIAAYNKFGDENIQLKVFQTLSPGQDYYAIPNYASAANWIWLDGQIAYFQKQNIENSINPSAIIKLFKNFTNPEDEQEYVNGLTSSFASARNAGKVMVFVTDDPTTAPEITIAEPNKLDRAFAGVQTNIINNVAYAHIINPALMGVAVSGKLGATQELIDSYSLFNSVYVKPTQQVISSYLTEIAHMMNIDAKVTLINNVSLDLKILH
jgi:hypothetical protein